MLFLHYFGQFFPGIFFLNLWIIIIALRLLWQKTRKSLTGEEAHTFSDFIWWVQFFT